jgi:hypothetical protein
MVSPPMRTAPAFALACLLATPAVLAACSSSSSDEAAATEPPGTEVIGSGAADPAWFTGRKLDWVHWETRHFQPGSVSNALAHLTRKRLEPGYVLPGPIPDDAWDGAIAKMDALEDGRDFLALSLIAITYGFPDDLSPALRGKVDAALSRFKFWYTDAVNPPRPDNSYYWTENHQALYGAIEYLVGSRHANEPIGTDGRLGSEHAKAGSTRLLAWLEHRLRFGFSEWHSNVYFQKDITPMLTLVEHAPDEAIRARASMVLDLLFFDLALNTEKDAFGVTHGRSYKKDKMTSTDEDTWDITKILFGQSTYDYGDFDDGGAILSANTKYVYPEILRRVAQDPGPMVDRERISLPIDETTPAQGDPVAPFGLSYDHDQLMTWWGIGALTTYPIVPLTLAEFDQYGLWDNQSFADLASFRTLSSSPQFAQNLSSSSFHMINFGLLSEVDTYTYRNSDVMLSSAIDWRKGSFSQQLHSWQATLDAKAIVFTNHPFRPLATTGDWLDDPENGGYWNGEATAPRSAQIENVSVHMYAPQWPQTNAKPFDYFHWEPYTHAYFPQDYFDEVVQNGNWTFGRLGKGYVALYSWRTPQYLVYDGTTQATGGRVKPFDLVASGGADNVWIAEVSREADAGSFAAFQSAIAAATVTVTPRGPASPDGISQGFDVVYESPSQGHVTFGWEAPLTRRGEEIPLRGPGRLDNPWAHVETDPKDILVQKDGYGFDLSVKSGHRKVFGP